MCDRQGVHIVTTSFWAQNGWWYRLDDIVATPIEIPSILWKIVKNSAERDHDGNVLNAYMSLVLMCRNIKRDVDHQHIMSTVRRYQEGSDAMGFKEALLKAVNKRKHLIQQKIEELDESEDEMDESEDVE